MYNIKHIFTTAQNFGVRFFFFKSIHLFIKEASKWSKVTVKTFTMLLIIYIKNKFYSSVNPGKSNVSQFPQKYCAARLFSTLTIIRNVS